MNPDDQALYDEAVAGLQTGDDGAAPQDPAQQTAAPAAGAVQPTQAGPATGVPTQAGPAGLSIEQWHAFVKQHKGLMGPPSIPPGERFIKVPVTSSLPDPATGEYMTTFKAAANPNPAYKYIFNDKTHATFRAGGVPNKIGGIDQPTHYEVVDPGTSFDDPDKNAALTALRNARADQATATAGKDAALARKDAADADYAAQNGGLTPIQKINADIQKAAKDWEVTKDKLRQAVDDRKISLSEAMAQSTQEWRQMAMQVQQAGLKLREEELAQQRDAANQRFAGDITHAGVSALGQYLNNSVDPAEMRNLNKARQYLMNPMGAKPTMEDPSGPGIDPQQFVMDMVHKALGQHSPAIAQAGGGSPNAAPGFQVGGGSTAGAMGAAAATYQGVKAGEPQSHGDDYRVPGQGGSPSAAAIAAAGKPGAQGVVGGQDANGPPPNQAPATSLQVAGGDPNSSGDFGNGIGSMPPFPQMGSGNSDSPPTLPPGELSPNGTPMGMPAGFQLPGQPPQQGGIGPYASGPDAPPGGGQYDQPPMPPMGPPQGYQMAPPDVGFLDANMALGKEGKGAAGARAMAGLGRGIGAMLQAGYNASGNAIAGIPGVVNSVGQAMAPYQMVPGTGMTQQQLDALRQQQSGFSVPR